VAIKVVHQDLAATLGPERFLAEIRTTAKLQHPHVLPLLDSGDADGILYYVMPYVAGESLRQRLERDRQLAVDEAVTIAREVADALGHAHAHGIVHRDIKPENILLQEGHALVADFGIALAVQSAGGARMTQTGLSLGTPSYMSPEQAMGERSVDARTDIYALGAVTYEMLTGEPPFSGATVQAIVAKVLSAEPQRPTLIRKTIPPHVEGAVLKALAKLPADRWARAADFATALAQPGSAAAAGMTAIAPPATRSPVLLRALLATTSALAVLGGAGSFWLATREPAPPVAARFDVRLPDSTVLGSLGGHKLALSRDGTRMLVVVTRADGHRFYVRRLDDPGFQLVRGSEVLTNAAGNFDPAFSPDGEWIVFTRVGRLMRLPTAGGRPETLSDSGSGGPDWADDNTLLYTRGGAIWRLNASGGPGRLVAAPDTSRRIFRLRWPHALPGTRHALVTLDRAPAGNIADSMRLAVLSLEDGAITELGVTGTDARYVATGHVVFARVDGVVFAAPFSLRSRTLTGPPVRLLEGVWIGGGGAAGISVADNGTIVWHVDVDRGANTLVVVDAEGRERRVPAEPLPYALPRVSPDGRRIVTEMGSGLRTGPGPLLLVDLETGARQLLGGQEEGMAPEWSRDGRRIFFVKRTGNSQQLVSRAWDRSAPDDVVVLDSTFRTPVYELAIGPPGAWAAIRVARPNSNRDILLAPMSALDSVRPFVVTPATERTPSFSPDGQWLAYASDESGRDEVYVQPVPGPGPRIQVSISGGTEPAWADRGTTLYFRGSARMMVAEFGGSPFGVLRRDSLFVDEYIRSGSATRGWSPLPGGRGFLMVRPSQRIREIGMILNWPQLPALRSAAAEP
jgi:Tol biopolymer transport system component